MSDHPIRVEFPFGDSVIEGHVLDVTLDTEFHYTGERVFRVVADDGVYRTTESEVNPA